MAKKWHSKIVKHPTVSDGWRGAMGGLVFVEDFMPDDVRKMEYGPLFAYMYRRFGVPEWGSDSHKEIANWYITTPDPNVALCVSPRPSGITHSFGYLVNIKKYNDRRDDPNTEAAVKKALTAAMLDLLVPVFVRDVPINGIGRVVEHAKMKSVDEFEWAGYGVDHAYFEKAYGEPE